MQSSDLAVLFEQHCAKTDFFQRTMAFLSSLSVFLLLSISTPSPSSINAKRTYRYPEEPTTKGREHQNCPSLPTLPPNRPTFPPSRPTLIVLLFHQIILTFHPNVLPFHQIFLPYHQSALLYPLIHLVARSYQLCHQVTLP